MDEPVRMASDAAFAAVNAAFGSLGRVCLALDSAFRVRYVSARLDALLGEGSIARTIGAPAAELLGPELFGADAPMRQALAAGERREGWRALLRAGNGTTHLLSVTAAPLQRDPHGVCPKNADYLVVLRPAEEEPEESSGPVAADGLVWRSRAMAKVLRLVESLQHSEASVLITGESGTGKEVMARLLHSHSPRRNGPFVAVNVAALPGELLESELFGHVRGAFTGATRDRPGRFMAASQGTLFLDEVGELPLHLQVKLLRVLQEHTYERVGENQVRQADARIIAATNRDLRAAVGQGKFREDLYYRLRVFPIELPPLRQRREDIEPMAQRLLARVQTRTGRALRFSPDALRTVLSYAWPGNVRELENALEYAVTVARGQTLQPEDLPPEVLAGAAATNGQGAAAGLAADAPDASPDATPDATPPGPLRARPAVGAPEEGERAALEAALQACRWCRADTARALGISRSTLWRRMRALRLG
jgi:transcriptional regulator with GAF, ATPase, and Fis domain